MNSGTQLADSLPAVVPEIEASIYDKLHAVIWAADPKSLKLDFLNSTAERLLGCSRGDYDQIGSADRLVHPDDRPKLLKAIGRIQTREDESARLELRLLQRTGGSTWMRTDIGRMDNGPLLCVMWDVSTYRTGIEKLKSITQEQRTAQMVARLGYWKWRVDSNHTEFSEELCRILEVSSDRLRNYQDYIQVVHPLDRALVDETVRMALREKKGFEYTHRILTPNGNVKYLSCRGEFVATDGGERVLFGTSLDITEETKLRKQLEESERRYRQIVETAEEGVWVIDAEGRTAFMNQKMVELFGYRYSERQLLQGKHFVELVSEELRDRAVECLARRRAGIREHLELTLRRRDGGELYTLLGMSPIYDSKGEYSGALAMATEIGTRVLLERKLQESLSLLNATIETSADGILVVDRKGRIVTSNHQFLKLWSLPEEILGWMDDELALAYAKQHLKHPEEFLNRVREFYSNPEMEGWDEIQFKDGRVLERYTGPQRIGGDVVGRVWRFRDVTQQKKVSAERERLLAKETSISKQAREAVKAREELLAIVSHDLKNPLSNLLAGLSLLEVRMNAADQRSKLLLSTLKKSAHRMEDLTAGLLTKAQISAGKFTIENFHPFLIKDLVVDSFEEFRLQAQRKGVSLTYSIPPKDAFVLCDERRIQQVLANLIGNALKFTPSGGRIEIAASEEDDHVLFKVSDNGPGIPESRKPTLFKPFDVPKGPGSGSGLGLFICRGIVEAHGGHIWIESTEGLGTTVYFTLKNARVKGPEEPSLSSRPSPSSQKRVS